MTNARPASLGAACISASTTRCWSPLAQAATEQFARAYRRRSLAERSIAWIVKDGHRRCRYRGVKRNQLGLSLRVAAVNLLRLLNLGLHHSRDSWRVHQPA